VHKHVNGLKTALLLGAMSALVVMIALPFGRGAVLIALVLVLGMTATPTSSPTPSR